MFEDVNLYSFFRGINYKYMKSLLESEYVDHFETQFHNSDLTNDT